MVHTLSRCQMPPWAALGLAAVQWLAHGLPDASCPPSFDTPCASPARQEVGCSVMPVRIQGSV